MYLNQWSLNFSPENYVPSIVHVSVRLPHIPLHCWSNDSLCCIGNTLGCYIDRAEPKENIFSCARICVEVDLEKGLPKAMLITLNNWKHI
jgi:hypothetical protein